MNASSARAEAPIVAKDSLSTPLGIADGAPPSEIQYLPPGRHKITPYVDGQPKEITANITAKSAEILQNTLREFRIKAAEGIEDLPYFDFNHDDGAASGRPTRFFWGGEDPRTGGVRAEVEWTDPAKQALSSKPPTYRRFSPQLYLNAAGEVTGAPLNMGGLVYRAAFKTITPIVAGAPGARAEAPGDNTRKANMEAEKLAADLAAAQRKITDLTTQLSKAQSEEVVKAKDAEIKTLKDKITTLENATKEQAKENAKALVQAKVAQGAIAPQDTATQEMLVEAIAANPKASALLDKFTPNPALGTVIINPGAGATTSGAGTGEHQFVVKAKAFAAQQKLSFADATVQVAAAEPALYEDYRRTLAPAAAKK